MKNGVLDSCGGVLLKCWWRLGRSRVRCFGGKRILWNLVCWILGLWRRGHWGVRGRGSICGLRGFVWVDCCWLRFCRCWRRGRGFGCLWVILGAGCVDWVVALIVFRSLWSALTAKLSLEMLPVHSLCFPTTPTCSNNLLNSLWCSCSCSANFAYHSSSLTCVHPEH